MSYIKMEGEHGGSMDIANQNLANNNNLEIIRKISQILDDQMDSSNLANFMSQQTKATNSTLNTNAEAFYPSNVVTPVMCQNANYTPGGTMYTNQTHAMTNPPVTGQHVHNQELMAGLQKLGNLNWAAIQQAVAASKQQQQQQDPSSFIPGAISNRTLEHLTESMTRPARAIKGGDATKTHIQQEHHTPAQNVGTIGDSRPSSTSNTSPSHNLTNAMTLSGQQVSNNSVMNMVNQSALSALNNSLMGMTSHGPIGSPEPSIHGQQSSTPAPSVMTNSSGTTMMNMSMGSRSCTPESDTSGISSGGTSDVSDVALIDLMYNLNLGVKTNAHTQTTPPTLAPTSASQQPIHSTSSVVQQLAAAATQQQQQQQPQVQHVPQHMPVQQQHQHYQSQQPVQQHQQHQHSSWQPAVAQPSQQQQQQAQNVYMYPQQQQPSAHSYPQTSTTIAQSLVPYQQAIQIDSYAGQSQPAPASLISPYVIQPAHVQPPVTSQQPAAVATTYPAISQYSNMDLLRMLACDMNNPAATAGAYPSQLTPQPVQTVTPVHQVAPADFAQNMDLVTERSSSAKSTSSALSTLFGPVGATGLTHFGAATAADQAAIEKAAKWYRGAASVYEATCTWSGQLPPKIYKNPTYSCKVFLGGVPWDITEVGLQNAFKAFGPTRIEWPQEGKHKIRNPMKAGYVYVLFETDKSVKTLLQSCTHDFSNGGEYYFKISSRRMRSKEVQVIPWVLSDSNYVKQPSQRLDPTKTVFVGALHGMMNAEGLAQIMNDLFGNVVYAGIDTDKHKYPIGSGRVTFSSHKSFMKAVNAAFVEVKTPKFTKKVQIDPYLEDSMCNSCASQAGPYFCRDLACFRYYCRHCWQFFHAIDSARHHKPLMRNNVRANAEV